MSDDPSRAGAIAIWKSLCDAHPVLKRPGVMDRFIAILDALGGPDQVASEEWTKILTAVVDLSHCQATGRWPGTKPGGRGAS